MIKHVFSFKKTILLWPFIWGVSAVTHAQPQALTIKGSLMVDAYQTGPFYDNKDQNLSGYTLRSSKLAMDYQVSSNIKSKLQVEYDSDIHDQDTIKFDDVISDAYADIKLTSKLNVRLGKMKQVAGFERNTSSKNLSTTERSMLSRTFFNGREVGIKLFSHKKHLGWSLGYFDNDDDNQQSMQGFSYIQLNPFYLGLTIHQNTLNDQLFQLKSSGEMNTADNIIRSPRFYAQDSLTTQLDSLFQNNHWRLHASYANMAVQQTQGSKFQFQGGFIQLSHSTSSIYKFNKGKQKQLKHGWEYVVRFSALDLLDNGNGSQASIVTTGINYYQGNGFKYMANVLLPEIKGQVSSLKQDGYGLTARVQYQF